MLPDSLVPVVFEYYVKNTDDNITIYAIGIEITINKTFGSSDTKI